MAQKKKNPQLLELIEAEIEFRKEHELTQSDMAKLIRTSQPAISRFESGEQDTTLRFLQKIAAGMGKKLVVEFVDKKNPRG